jgi:hypothetical protein
MSRMAVDNYGETVAEHHNPSARSRESMPGSERARGPLLGAFLLPQISQGDGTPHHRIGIVGAKRDFPFDTLQRPAVGRSGLD